MHDVCIIGIGGVIGSAISRELALAGLSVVGIEKHIKACQETSGLNSRVVHSGFHETSGSLKATLAREGSKRLIQYTQDRGIAFKNTGMLIAVPHGSIREGLWREASSLVHLCRQGRRQQITFDFIVTPRGIRKRAPIRALGGIFIPSVGVVNVEQLVDAFEADAREAHAIVHYCREVKGIDVDVAGYVIHLDNGERIHSRMLINSGGLHAHEISLMAGGPKYDIEILRGDYYEMLGGVARWNIHTLVYPAMPPKSPSKGVHFGPRTDGRLFIGPSATLPSAPMSKQLFLQAGRRFLPELTDSDLQWAYFGLRPKHAGRDGKSDFVIRVDRNSPPLINLIGIDSPGLSASMGIAEYVAGLIKDIDA